MADPIRERREVVQLVRVSRVKRDQVKRPPPPDMAAAIDGLLDQLERGDTSGLFDKLEGGGRD